MGIRKRPIDTLLDNFTEREPLAEELIHRSFLDNPAKRGLLAALSDKGESVDWLGLFEQGSSWGEYLISCLRGGGVMIKLSLNLAD